MDKKIFNCIYAKFNKKDYFSNKEFIRARVKESIELLSRDNNPAYKILPGQIKAYLKHQKTLCYDLAVKRINEYKAGIIYPKREKFTWEIIKAVGLTSD